MIGLIDALFFQSVSLGHLLNGLFGIEPFLSHEVLDQGLEVGLCGQLRSRLDLAPASYQEDTFALDFLVSQAHEHLIYTASNVGLITLGQLPSYDHGPVWTQFLANGLQSLLDSVGRLVEYSRCLLACHSV